MRHWGFNMERVRLYREHKYLTTVLFDICIEFGKSDLRNQTERHALASKVFGLRSLLESHGQYEESRIHARLSARGSDTHKLADGEHERDLGTLDAILEQIKVCDSPSQAHQGYLRFRKFVAEVLLHLDFEENVMLPKLQELYSDDELRLIDKESYDQMDAGQMIDMLQVLFPSMNADDKEFFIDELHRAAPGLLKRNDSTQDSRR